MKILFLTPCLILAFAFTDLQETEKSPLRYEITYQKADASLVNGQSRAEFTFINSSGSPITDSILASYNEIPVTLFPDKNGKASLNLKSGNYAFQFFCNEYHHEIYTDSIKLKPGYRTGIRLDFEYSMSIDVAEKPVIYVYPDKTMSVNIQLEVNGKIGYTYPSYNSGWNFVADPDGTIHLNDKEYDYLFWDCEVNVNYDNVDLNSGFVVNNDSLTQFFEEKLSAMGLNPREQQDFITYWVPQMLVNENNYVHFMFSEEYGSVAGLKVTPAPDHMFRVFMVWNNAADMNTDHLKDQKIESFSREGFTVVEWGGAQAENISDLQ